MKTLDAGQLAALNHDLPLWRCEGDTALLRQGFDDLATGRIGDSGKGFHIS